MMTLRVSFCFYSSECEPTILSLLFFADNPSPFFVHLCPSLSLFVLLYIFAKMSNFSALSCSSPSITGDPSLGLQRASHSDAAPLPLQEALHVDHRAMLGLHLHGLSAQCPAEIKESAYGPHSAVGGLLLSRASAGAACRPCGPCSVRAWSWSWNRSRSCSRSRRWSGRRSRCWSWISCAGSRSRSHQRQHAHQT